MFHREILSNGIRLVTVPMRDTQTVTVLVLVQAGSKYETKAINGISHFLEHMMFKGTTRRPNTLAISEELDSVGAENNAFTGDEYTGYYVKADSSKLELALDMLSDVLLHSKFEEAEIEKEKGVVVEEINMFLDEPRRHVQELLEQVVHGDQPAGWDVAGTKETVRALTRADIVDYMGKHYGAGAMTVCVAGNVDEAALREKVSRYFDAVPRGGTQQKRAVVRRQTTPQSLVEYKKTDQTHFCIAFRSAVNAFDDRRYAFSLLANIMGGNMSSRLFINIREKQGLAYYVSAGQDVTSDTGAVTARAGVDNARAPHAVVSVLHEFVEVAKNGVTEKELKRAKDYFRGKILLDLETSDQRAGFFGMQEVIGKKLLTPEETLAKTEAVTCDEVNAAARELVAPHNINLALVGPFEKKEEFDRLLAW
ncbi:MAG: pitrilysin family protein [Patescibacteria group bacterium]